MVCQLPAGNDATSTAVYKDESSSSEDEDEFRAEIDGTVSESVNNISLPNGIIVNDSTHVHIGNKTYNGNVTIKQFLYPNCNAHANDVDLSDEQWTASDSDTKVYNKSDDQDYNHENKKNTYVEAGTPDAISGLPTRWCAVLVGLVILLATVALAVSSLFAIETLRQNGPSDGGRGPPSIPNIPTNDSGIFYNGLRVTTRDEWLAQPAVKPLDPLQTPVPRVIITHTASESCDTTPKCIAAVRYIQMFHVEAKQWNDIGYNFLVGGDGVAYIGRGWDAIGAHTKTYNNVSIGIAFVGTFVNIKPPDVQIAAAKKLIEVGLANNKISKSYILNAHCQLMSTASPGYCLYLDMKTWGHLDTGKTPYSCKNDFANFTDDSQHTTFSCKNDFANFTDGNQHT